MKTTCKNCGQNLLDWQEFCPKCGTPKNGQPTLDLSTRVCEDGHSVPEGLDYCGKCGKPVKKVTVKSEPVTRVCEDGHPVPEGLDFCGKCGKPVKKVEKSIIALIQEMFENLKTSLTDGKSPLFETLQSLLITAIMAKINEKKFVDFGDLKDLMTGEYGKRGEEHAKVQTAFDANLWPAFLRMADSHKEEMAKLVTAFASPEKTDEGSTLKNLIETIKNNL